MADGVEPRFRLTRARATAAEFHGRVVPDPARAELWWHEVTAPALVLGSSQDDSIVDRGACRRAGVEVVRRRSGGGAVLLVPDEVTWIDVIVPADGPGWADDVHGPMRWLGDHLAAVVAGFVADVTVAVHRSGHLTTPWSPVVCFDGVGTGEVLVDGAKLVGMSQRRTRAAARLQCCWYHRYDPARLVDLLVPDRRPSPDELTRVATVPAPVAEAIPPALAARLG